MNGPGWPKAGVASKIVTQGSALDVLSTPLPLVTLARCGDGLICGLTATVNLVAICFGRSRLSSVVLVGRSKEELAIKRGCVVTLRCHSETRNPAESN